MTSENNGMFSMPVVPASSGYGNGDGMFGGGWMWFLLVWMAMFGWGGNGGFGVNGGTGSEIQRGFDQAAVTGGINALQQAQCNGFAQVTGAVSNGFAQAEIAANSRQMADMNQTFAMQSALQTCCCENRAATADLKYTIAQGNRDVIDNDNRNHQAVMDKLCALELAGVKQQLDDERRTTAELRTQLLVAQGAASQNAQTAAIQAGQRTLANEIEQYVLPTPRPCYVVQNPNCCGQYGYGYGYNAA